MKLTLLLDGVLVELLITVSLDNIKVCIVDDEHYNITREHLSPSEILFTYQDIHIARALLNKFPRMTHDIRFTIYESIIVNRKGKDKFYCRPCYDYAVE